MVTDPLAGLGSNSVRRVATGLAAILVLASFPVPTFAQGEPEEGASIRGVVTDSSGTPLEGIEVEVVGARRTVTTGPTGTYLVTGLRNSRFWVRARGIGYLPQQISVSLRNDERRELPFTLSAAPVDLPDVVVRGRDERYERRMSDFMWRSRSAWGGRFLTRDDIGRSHAVVLGDLVTRYMPFKHSWAMDRPGGDAGLFTDAAFNTSRLVRRRNYRPDCPPAVAVNGGPVTAGYAVNDFRPEEVEALEVYRDGGSVPIEYSFGHRADCGLVIVWLKSYVEPSLTR